MVNPVFAVYDNAVKAFMTPFIQQSQGQAIRGFMDACDDEKTNLSRHPEDYTLFQIATYDDANGRYENLDTPEALGTALKFKSLKNKIEPLKAAQ